METLMAFSVASAVVTIAPGPDILTVMSRSIAQGRAAGLAAACGFASGLVVHTTVVALGLAYVIQRQPAVFAGICACGAAYLLYLAVALWRAPVAAPGESAERRAFWRIYGQSVIMNVLNPKVAIFFLFFLPGFVPATDAHLRWWLVLLGALFALHTLVIFGAVAVFAAPVGAWLRDRAGAAKWLQRGVACLFLVLAVRLLWMAWGQVG